MSWIEDQHADTIYHYKSNDTERDSGMSGTVEELAAIFQVQEVKAEPGESFQLGDLVFTYAGFEPNKLNLRTEVEFVKNGRKAVEFRKNGKVQCLSKSKLEYMRTGKITSQNEKSFDDAIAKAEMQYMVKEEKENLRRAAVRQNWLKENSGGSDED